MLGMETGWFEETDVRLTKPLDAESADEEAPVLALVITFDALV